MNNDESSLLYTLTTAFGNRKSPTACQSYVAHMKSVGSFDTDALVAAVAAESGQDANFIRYLESIRRRHILKALRDGKKVFLDGLAVATSIRGKFDTIDGEFDPDRNSVVVTCYTYEPLQSELSKEVPKNVVKGCCPRISKILEMGQLEEEVLVSGRDVTITGRDIGPTVGAADEGVALVYEKTGEVVATAEIASSNLVEVVCTFPTLPSAGRYQLVIATRGGNGEEYKVAKASRDVTVK